MAFHRPHSTKPLNSRPIVSFYSTTNSLKSGDLVFVSLLFWWNNQTIQIASFLCEMNAFYFWVKDLWSGCLQSNNRRLDRSVVEYTDKIEIKRLICNYFIGELIMNTEWAVGRDGERVREKKAQQQLNSELKQTIWLQTSCLAWIMYTLLEIDAISLCVHLTNQRFVIRFQSIHSKMALDLHTFECVWIWESAGTKKRYPRSSALDFKWNKTVSNEMWSIKLCVWSWSYAKIAHTNTPEHTLCTAHNS